MNGMWREENAYQEAYAEKSARFHRPTTYRKNVFISFEHMKDTKQNKMHEGLQQRHSRCYK